MVNGAVRTAPNELVTLLVLAKKATLVTVPPLTVALAVMGTLAGAMKVAPPLGLVMLTVGADAGGLTVMLTTAEVAEIPAAVATAVRE